MDPITLGLIGAGASSASSLLQKLLEQKMERERQQRELEAKALETGFAGRQQAAKQLGEGQQSAFAQLMQSYQGILGR